MALSNCNIERRKHKESLLNQKTLKQFVHYSPETGLFTWNISLNNRLNIGDIAGSKTSHGYIVISINQQSYKAHRLAFLYMTGGWPEHQIDHKNRIRTNNKWSNLKPATQKINSKNRSISKNNISGTTGIHWNKLQEKWQAYIGVNKKLIPLGCFIYKYEAIKARKDAEKKYNFKIIPIQSV